MEDRSRENEWRKEKAILEQRIELQGLQILELKQREESYKKFNDTILNAYNVNDASKCNSKVYKEIQQTLEQYSRDLIGQKNRNSEIITQLEQENRELKNLNSILEQRIRELTSRYEKEIYCLEQKLDGQPSNENQYTEAQVKQMQIDIKHQMEEQLKRKLQEQEKVYSENLEYSEAQVEQMQIDIKHQVEEQFKGKLQDQEKVYSENLEQLKQNFEKEKQELLRKSDQHLPVFRMEDTQRKLTPRQHEVEAIKPEKTKSPTCENHPNKENINQQMGYMSFKSNQSIGSDTKAFPLMEKNIPTGCIVSAKSKQNRSRTQLGKNQQQQQQINQKSALLQRQSESFNTDEVIEHRQKKISELSISQYSNISQMNCKNSNVMEVHPQQLLQTSDLFKMMDQKDLSTISISPINAQHNNILNLLQSLQNQKNSLESKIMELESLSPTSQMITERQKLHQQLRLITQELKKTKVYLNRNLILQFEFENQEGDNAQGNSQLKHEIKFMINKLLKAKGKLTESFISSSSISLSQTFKNPPQPKPQARDPYQMKSQQEKRPELEKSSSVQGLTKSYEQRSSLAQFSLQLSQARSIGEFGQSSVIKSTKRYQESSRMMGTRKF